MLGLLMEVEDHALEGTTIPSSGSRPTPDDVLLSVEDLKTYYPTYAGLVRRRVGWVMAVDGVSLVIRRGETLGVVGESGCGKSTLARSIVRLEATRGGKVVLDGVDLLGLTGRDLRAFRQKLQIVFQDPEGSLNPRMKVGTSISEGLRAQGVQNRRERRETVANMLTAVGLRPEFAQRYPHEFSGGQRQRIGIARRLSVATEITCL